MILSAYRNNETTQEEQTAVVQHLEVVDELEVTKNNKWGLYMGFSALTSTAIFNITAGHFAKQANVL